MSIFLRKIDSTVAVPVYTIWENALAEPTPLLACPVATAIASIVSVADTAIGAVYLVEAVVGAVPFVV
jgi:hypothetical protein